MKNTFLTLLRDKNTPLDKFREAADRMATVLSYDVLNVLEKEEYPIETPIKQTQGQRLKTAGIVLIPIWRAGIALLSPF